MAELRTFFNQVSDLLPVSLFLFSRVGCWPTVSAYEISPSFVHKQLGPTWVHRCAMSLHSNADHPGHARDTDLGSEQPEKYSVTFAFICVSARWVFFHLLLKARFRSGLFWMIQVLSFPSAFLNLWKVYSIFCISFGTDSANAIVSAGFFIHPLLEVSRMTSWLPFRDEFIKASTLYFSFILGPDLNHEWMRFHVDGTTFENSFSTQRELSMTHGTCKTSINSRMSLSQY